MANNPEQSQEPQVWLFTSREIRGVADEELLSQINAVIALGNKVIDTDDPVLQANYESSRDALEQKCRDKHGYLLVHLEEPPQE